MKGKIGLVVGLGIGYVLGTRAGRERYEQIKKQWLKVWNLDPVQAQVSKVQDFAKAQAAAVPQALWTGAVRVVKAARAEGTPGQRVDSTIATGKSAAEDVKRAAEETVHAAGKTAEKAAEQHDGE
ncbi:hypothetical protein [Microbacterium capsulatum]|uniref:Protoporphyrinogen oxidase n=1 Tax=Microbacterium capsulatum TaxID=3041921 RepID=A0ABU0XE25_9MICO|nr:hypothetical protein [Microbacterium sp. ASV81]MDQ4213368.1 hypothetical protein [Microbacterium sp. ASV81]